MSVSGLLHFPSVPRGFDHAHASSLVDTPNGARIQSIVARECGLVWRTLRRFGVPESLVDDATQTVFLTLSVRIQQVPADNERAFLIGTCLRVASNMRRSLARNREVPSLPIELADRSHDPERLLELKQRRQVLDMALDQLPHDQRVVFVLFELEGFSLPEVASSLGIPLGTATSRLRRGRQRFEAWVAERESSGGRP